MLPAEELGAVVVHPAARLVVRGPNIPPHDRALRVPRLGTGRGALPRPPVAARRLHGLLRPVVVLLAARARERLGGALRRAHGAHLHLVVAVRPPHRARDVLRARGDDLAEPEPLLHDHRGRLEVAQRLRGVRALHHGGVERRARAATRKTGFSCRCSTSPTTSARPSRRGWPAPARRSPPRAPARPSRCAPCTSPRGAAPRARRRWARPCKRRCPPPPCRRPSPTIRRPWQGRRCRRPWQGRRWRR